MDKVGRKAVGVPSLVIIAVSLLLLPLSRAPAVFVLAAIVAGCGNGASAGIVMTLGADFAPADRRAEFLGVWRLLTDLGSTAGPLLLSAVASGASLSPGGAAAVTALVGFAGAFIMWRFVPETLKRRTPTRDEVALELAPLVGGHSRLSVNSSLDDETFE
eukprot:Amastigsp_a355022_6.p3 type:complete len:160 gc:universal Amastigsp_a355022_6:517-38(-)